MKRCTIPLCITLVLLAGTACSSRTGEVFRLVRPPVAFEMLRDNPDLQVIDLREVEAYAGPSGHLAGALCFPLGELDARVAELRRLNDLTFLIYCDTSQCTEAGLEWFLANDFKNAMVMDGGIDDWIRDGFGTVVSATPRRTEPEVAATPE